MSPSQNDGGKWRARPDGGWALNSAQRFAHVNPQQGPPKSAEETQPTHSMSILPAMSPTMVVLVGDAYLDTERTEELLKHGMLVLLAPHVEVVKTTDLRGISGSGRQSRGDCTIIRFDRLAIDFVRHRASWEEHPLDLTEQELRLLAVLVRSPRALCFAELSTEVWGLRYGGDPGYIRCAVKRIRRKLIAAGATIKIEAVRGYGFRLATLTG